MKIEFKTKNSKYKQVKELHEIYQFMKYFYINICNDLRPTILNSNESYIKTDEIIEKLINPLDLSEFRRYHKILCSNDIHLSSLIQETILNKTKWYKVIKNKIYKIIDCKPKIEGKYSNRYYHHFERNIINHYKNIYDKNNDLKFEQYEKIIYLNLQIFQNFQGINYMKFISKQNNNYDSQMNILNYNKYDTQITYLFKSYSYDSNMSVEHILKIYREIENKYLNLEIIN